MPATKQAIENAKELGINIDRLPYMDKLMAQWVAEDKLPTLLFSANRNGVPIFKGAYGTSGSDEILDENLIFPVCSITKPVVATLLFIAQEDGLLDVGDPVRHYIDAFNAEGYKDIAIWHLLTHTSGLDEGESDSYAKKYALEKFGLPYPGDDATNEAWNEYGEKIADAMEIPKDIQNRGHAAYEKILFSAPPVKKPRERMLYNNFGLEMAKRIVEKVSGEAIDTYAQKKLFTPLQMSDTHWLLPQEKWGRVVRRGERCMGYPWLNTEDCFKNTSGGGGLKSTVHDMLRFLEMIRQQGTLDGVQILSKISVTVMRDNHNADMPSVFDAWGLGWNYHGMKKDDAGILRSKTSIEHGGFGGSKILVDFEHGITFVFFGVEYGEGTIGTYFTRASNMLFAALL